MSKNKNEAEERMNMTVEVENIDRKFKDKDQIRVARSFVHRGCRVMMFMRQTDFRSTTGKQ